MQWKIQYGKKTFQFEKEEIYQPIMGHTRNGNTDSRVSSDLVWTVCFAKIRNILMIKHLDYLTICGILGGTLLIIIYVLYSSRKKVPVHLANAAILFLTCLTFVAGIKLIIFALNPELLDLLKKEV